MKIITTLFLPILLLGGVSCGPTTDTLQAPFKLTGDFTSSTSGSSPIPDPSAKARQRLEQFMAHAYDGVSGDIAQGHGEYLTSLAVLAGIPMDEQTAFGMEMQNRYAVLSDPLLSRKEASTLVLNHAWSAGYGKTAKKHNPTAVSGL
ncbi:MAG: DUF3015 family protein [Nitrospira sp.]